MPKATGKFFYRFTYVVMLWYSANRHMAGGAVVLGDSLPLDAWVWRLPNVNELKSIADRSTSNPAIDAVAFPATFASNYWSSSYATITTYAWYVHFGDGNVTAYLKTNGGWVRCVSQ
jgi:hypothetical protein